MKKKIIISIFFLLLFSICNTQVWAKYVIEETLPVATIRIDRTDPKLQVNYSIEELTSENIEVTIKADEQIQEIDGWTLQEDKKTLKKEYAKNIQEEISVKDLSGNVTKIVITINNIDKELPTITITKIINSNIEYPSYANKDAEITFTILIQDDKKIEKSLEEKDIKILINNKEITPKQKIIEIQKDMQQEKELLLTISGIEEEGNLTLKIPKGVIKDEIGNSNIDLEQDTKIEIDNTNPQASYSQNKIQDGKIEAIITAGEAIRKLDGWNLEEEKVLKKIFNNNLSYTTTIKDLAGNSANVEVNIVEATNIVLSYASHNSEIGWSYGYGNYDIAGLEVIKKNAKYKTESLAFTILGDVEKDFLQAKAYVYTHWGEEAASICHESNQIYYHGWNPSESEWSTLLSKENITLEGKNYIQFGGTGLNRERNTDINGNNPISGEISKEYRYGISAIQLKLKDDSEYSIIYQIYVDQVGWVEPAKNGEIECYKTNMPISALRITLVPNSEVNAVLKTWNEDTREIN